MAITWLPNASDSREFGVDQSRYQPDTDYPVMGSTDIPPVFGAARSSISWGYTDPWVGHHLNGYKSIGVNERLGYHILYPNEDAQRQVNRAVKALVDNAIDPAKIVPVEDAELVHGASAFAITMKIEKMLPMYENSLYGRKPVIYTRPRWVRDHMLPVADWYEDVYWWMAVYTFTGQESSENLLINNMARDCPAIPIENVILAQTSEKGRGSAYGVKSEKLDYDRFRGTQVQWDDLFGAPTTPPVPGPEKSKVTVEYDPNEVELETVEV